MSVSQPPVSHLDAIHNLNDALSRVPGGAEVWRMLTRLQMWTPRSKAERQQLPQKFSALPNTELSDLSSRIIAELGLLVELCGLLTAVEQGLKLRARQARSAARVTARRTHRDTATADNADGKKTRSKELTVKELDDLAESDPAVIEVDEQLVLIAILRAQADACKEANTLYKEGVSREITFRAAQMQARII
jgi:hypothetical protein